MNRHHALKCLTLISLTALPLGTLACSNSSSPTEPAFSDLDQTAAASTGSGSLSSATDESRGRGRGGDDQQGDDRGGRRGRGADDQQGDDRGGRRGRGADDQQGDDRGGRRGGRGGRNGQDDNPRAPRGQEFEGAVASVGQGSLTLTNGTRVVVNGQTQWIARGDLHSLNQVAGAVAAGRPTRVEGRGTRQADGAFLAATIKAEVDD